MLSDEYEQNEGRLPLLTAEIGPVGAGLGVGAYVNGLLECVHLGSVTSTKVLL